MVAMFQAIISNVNISSLPYRIDVKRNGNKKEIILSNGVVLHNDEPMKDFVLLSPLGINTLPKVGTKAECFVDDNGLKFAFALDTFSKPEELLPSNPQIGNYDTKNILKFTNNEIIIDNEGTLEVFINTNIINLTAKESMTLNTPDLTLEGTTKTTLESPVVEVNASTSISLGTGAIKPVAYLGSAVDMVIGSPTYGTVISGSTKVTVVE